MHVIPADGHSWCIFKENSPQVKWRPFAQTNKQCCTKKKYQHKKCTNIQPTTNMQRGNFSSSLLIPYLRLHHPRNRVSQNCIFILSFLLQSFCILYLYFLLLYLHFTFSNHPPASFQTLSLSSSLPNPSNLQLEAWASPHHPHFAHNQPISLFVFCSLYSEFCFRICICII